MVSYDDVLAMIVNLFILLDRERWKLNDNSLKGIDYLWLGFTLIFKKELRLYVIMPLFINILLFIGMFTIGIHFFHELTVWINHFLPKWLHWLQWLLWIIFGLLIFTLYAYTFTLLTNLIGTPFNAFLSEKVELYLTRELSTAQSTWAEIIKSLPRSLGRQFQLLFYYLTRALLLLLLTFIPIVHIFVVIAWFLFTAWMLTVQYIDYPMDNHHISFKQLRQSIVQRKLLTLSFGISTLFLIYIPIINLFAMPAAVAGATAMWVKEFKDSR